MEYGHKSTTIFLIIYSQKLNYIYSDTFEISIWENSCIDQPMRSSFLEYQN